MENKIMKLEANGLVTEMNELTTSICTMSGGTREEQVKIYNLTSNPNKRIKDCINMPIKVKDIYIESVECESQTEVGVKVTCPRIVVIDAEGESYQCVSWGVFNSLKRIISILGAPTWEDPVTIIPKQIQKGNRSILTLVLG